jgi:hypothetical protein
MNETVTKKMARRGEGSNFIQNIPLDVWTRYNHLTRRYRGTSKDLIYEEVLRDYPVKVLDYGCGPEGTIGLCKTPILVIEGLDTDRDNRNACYHSVDEVDSFYDIIIFSHCIEHMSPAEAESTLRWMRDHCRELLMVTPNSGNPSFDFLKDLTHLRPYSTPHTLAMMERIGFDIKHVYYASMGRMLDLPFRALNCLGRDGKLNGLYYEYVVVAE